MRERLALGVLALTLLVILGLSGVFAMRPNAPRQPPSGAAGHPPIAAESGAPAGTQPAVVNRSALVALGRKVFAEQRCASCHAIAGEGNPRSALDGVGAEFKPDELRQWITGTGKAADLLTPAVQRRKQRYQTLPEQDLDALVAYLGSLQIARE